jgi:hypothetical protein
MNLNKTIESDRPVCSDYFILIYSRRSNKTLKDFTPLFNFNDYWCFKSTRHQRLVDEAEFLEFKHACYVFLKKEKYDLNHILNWVQFMVGLGGIQYLAKPLPPFDPNKIIIRK